MANPKTTFEHVQKNIEERLFGHALKTPDTIASNYPQAEITRAVMQTVLDWPNSRPQVERIINKLIKGATAVDGLSGEKGLGGYASWPVRGLGRLIEQYTWVDDRFLGRTFERHPQLRQSWRFLIDAWCFQKYYPLIGDSSSFARRITQYPGLEFQGKSSTPLDPSAYSFLWNLYELTGDPAYVQVMVHQNGGKTDGLPHDLFADDPKSFQKQVAEVIARHGTDISTGSVNKENWCLAILRTGAGDKGRALWISYDAGGAHGQCDGMNIGLFAYGMDFMPEFGYPRVAFGGWTSDKARWYRAGVPSHNTVCVDGKMQRISYGKWPSGIRRAVPGSTTLWADGESLKAIRVSAPKMVSGKQYERTVGMVAISEDDAYLFSIFRVAGGKDHAKFQHTQNGAVVTQGLALKPAKTYICDLGYKKNSADVLKNFRIDPDPQSSWSVDWHLKPIYDDSPKDAHFRYTDMTEGAEGALCDGWVKQSRTSKVMWLPMVMVRRNADKAPLASTFVDVMEAYRGASKIAAIRRLPVLTKTGRPPSDNQVAVEVVLAGGRKDLIVARDVENPLARNRGAESVLVEKPKVRFKGDFAFVRWSGPHTISRVVLCRARRLVVGQFEIVMKTPTPHVEIAFEANRARVVHGAPGDVAEIRIGEKTVQLER